ncbi:MAG: hypothetical protein Kow0092_20910 [Deferrisomatales bacterium]
MKTRSYDAFRDLLDRGAVAEAIRFAEMECLAQGGRSEFWLTQLSVALARDKQYGRAVEAADRALAVDPGSAYALLARAEALKGAGEAQEAAAAYEELLARGEPRLRARALKGLLECLAQREQWQRVLDLASDGSVPGGGAMRWRVRALAGLGRDEEAREACLEWLRRSPDHREALWQLTELDVRRDGLEAVRARMGRLARIPSRPPIYREIYASLCRRAGDEGKALAEYERLSAQAPNPRILRKQAFSLAKSGREEQAIPILEELLRMEPGDMYLHSSYGAACERAGQLERAWAFYQGLLADHPDEKSLFGRLRRIRKKMEKQAAEGL